MSGPWVGQERAIVNIKPMVGGQWATKNFLDTVIYKIRGGIMWAMSGPQVGH